MRFLASFASQLFLPCQLLFVLMGPLTPQATASPGDVDTLNVPIVGTQVYATAEQPDGKLIIAGSFSSVLGVPRKNIARLNADGTLDTTFSPGVGGSVFCVLLQSDGKIMIGGAFFDIQPPGAAEPVQRTRLARLNGDGSVDLDFTVMADGSVYCLSPQPDGKIWLAGAFQNLKLPDDFSFYRPRLARLNADGSADLGLPNFNMGTTVYSVVVQPDGKVLLGGAFSSILGMTRPRLARLNADLSLDTAFHPAPNSIVYAVALQPDGKVVLGGNFTTLQPNGATSPTTRNRLARVNADGTLDPGFDPGANGIVYSLALQTDGRMLAGGAFTSIASASRSYLARLENTGAVDAGFASNATAVVNSVVLQPNGKVVVGGAGGYLARLLNDPVLQNLTIVDASQVFWTRGGAAPEVANASLDLSVDNGVTWMPAGTGTRVLGGWAAADLNLPSAGILRMRGLSRGGIYNGTGKMVEQSLSFSGLAPLLVDIVVQGKGATISNVDQQPVSADGTDFGPILAAGAGSVTHTFTLRNTGAASLVLTGSLPVIIGGDHAGDFTVLAQPGTTVPAGSSSTFQIRFDPSARGWRTATVSIASNDPDENPHVFAIRGLGSASSDPDPVNIFEEMGEVYVIAEQPDGKVLLGGNFRRILGVPRSNIARLNADGTLDMGFDPNPQGPIFCLAVQPDGKVLFGGNNMTFQGSGNTRPYWRFFGGLPGLPGTVQFSTETVAGIEGSSATLSVARTGGSSGAISVGYATAPGTAGVSDHTPAIGVLNWADGDAAAKTITIPITNDAVAEGTESFSVCLGQPLGNTAILAAVQRATVNVSTAFDSWRSANFTPLELADSNISGDLADPDRDGLSNLLEFGLALPARSSIGSNAPGSVVQNISGADYLTLTFKRRSPALDLTYTVQTNNGTLGNPDWLGNAVQVGSAVSNGDGTETVTFRDSTAISGSTRRFMRVQVTRAP